MGANPTPWTAMGPPTASEMLMLASEVRGLVAELRALKLSTFVEAFREYTASVDRGTSAMVRMADETHSRLTELQEVQTKTFAAVSQMHGTVLAMKADQDLRVNVCRDVQEARKRELLLPSPLRRATDHKRRRPPAARRGRR